jgi:HPt (histidine-containing phosphotransfer) domain-containing protein
MIEKLVVSATESLEEALVELDEGYEKSNNETILRAYHSLKGILLNINCTYIAEKAKDLEMAMRDGKALNKIESDKVKLIEIIKNLISELRNGE